MNPLAVLSAAKNDGLLVSNFRHGGIPTPGNPPQVLLLLLKRPAVAVTPE